MDEIFGKCKQLDKETFTANNENGIQPEKIKEKIPHANTTISSNWSQQTNFNKFLLVSGNLCLKIITSMYSWSWQYTTYSLKEMSDINLEPLQFKKIGRGYGTYIQT